MSVADAPLPRRIQRFEILALIGRGGMGAVYQARDPQLERVVAVKVLASSNKSVAAALSPDDTLDLREDGPATADELLREAKMMAQLSHPNVLPVYEVGLADDTVFVVMEHIAGSDLAEWLESARTMPEIVDTFMQAAQGLIAAHARGIVHRDFKPANVLVGQDGRVRVADFGLSRMSAPGASMVRIDDGKGTPRYMAPELWRGDAASPKSDVYAFCAALEDALAGHDAPASLRAVIAAGLADDPGGRPQLPQILDALRGKPRGRRGVYVAAGVVALGIGALTIGLALTNHDGPDLSACNVDVAAIDRAWTPVDHFAIASSPKVSARLDDFRSRLDKQTAATCSGLRQGTITIDQARVRASCVERRGMELNEYVDWLIDRHPDTELAMLAATRLDWPEQCPNLTEPVLPADRTAIAALYRRYYRAVDLAVLDRTKEHESELRSLADIAEKLQERMIEAAIYYDIGNEVRFQDRFADADTAYQRVAELAAQIHHTGMGVDAIVQRSVTASINADPITALRYAELANDGAKLAPPKTQARARFALGRALSNVGNDDRAEPILREALALVQQAEDRDAEINTRNVLIDIECGRHKPDCVSLARDTVTFAKAAYGDPSTGLASALSRLAEALHSTNDFKGALEVRRESLAMVIATNPPGSGAVALQRADVAIDLKATGDIAGALAELKAAVASTENNERARGQRPGLVQELAVMTFESGDFAHGLALAHDAYEDSVSINGKSHPDSVAARTSVLDMEIETGDLVAAERDLAALEQLAVAGKDPRRSAQLAAHYRAIVLARSGRAAEAEPLAREALATLEELKAGPLDVERARRSLAEVLLARHKLDEALAEAMRARDIATPIDQRGDITALDDILIARAEAALGKREAAVAHARAASAVLERYPAQIQARADVAKLLR